MSHSPNRAPAAGDAGRSVPSAPLLEACCAQLDAELARQKRVLDSCVQQGRAARARDIESLDLATRELSQHTEDAFRAERDRRILIGRLEQHFEIAPGEFSLTALIQRAPQPWRPRLAELQAGLKDTLASTQRLLESNGRFLRDGARVADRILAEVLGPAASGPAYDSDGRQPGVNSISAMLNVAG